MLLQKALKISNFQKFIFFHQFIKQFVQTFYTTVLLWLRRIILTRAPRFAQLGGHRKLQTGKTAEPLPGILFRSCGSDWQYINLPPNRDACSNLLE